MKVDQLLDHRTVGPVATCRGRTRGRLPLLTLIGLCLAVQSSISQATPFVFNNGVPDARMAAASRPAAGPAGRIETADDFVIATQTRITSATFTGLLTNGAALSSLGDITVEIFRTFPKDSLNPASGNVPSRVNSPSDVVFDARSASATGLTFSVMSIASNFTAQNSVLNGIKKFPNQTTGGDGPVTGQEVIVTVDFATPFDLAPDHYFFVPGVAVTGGEFYWLSSSRPSAPPATVFSPDLQSWIRNTNLEPDWLRIGTDIVGGTPPPTFNQAFTLAGETSSVPEPLSLALFGGGFFAMRRARRRRAS